MKLARILIIAHLIALTLVACAPSRTAPEPLPEAVLLTAGEMAVLAFLNDHEIATQEILDVDCAIRSDAAENIITHRDGPDGHAGTRDDSPFANPDELLGVGQVGPWTVGQLKDCATSFGYAPTPQELLVLNFMNAPATSFDRLDVECSLRSDVVAQLLAHRDGSDGEPGTADDDPFHSTDELDSIYGVGDATLAQLGFCAGRFGYGVDAPDTNAPR